MECPLPAPQDWFIGEETEAERNFVIDSTTGLHPGLCGRVPALSLRPLVLDTVSVSQRLSPLIYFSSYLINKELETLSNCHLPKVTQLVSGGLGLGSLLDGIQLEGRRSGEVSLATQGHSNGCLPMGHATFTHGTQSSPRTRTACPFTSALPRGSLGQADTLTVGLGWAIQPGCVDQV